LLSEASQSGHLSVQDFDIFVRENEETVTMLAYYYRLLRGCPEGSPEVDWYRAEQKIDQELLSKLDLGLSA
jgi:hypothetical protein